MEETEDKLVILVDIANDNVSDILLTFRGCDAFIWSFEIELTSCCTFLTEFVMELGGTNGSMMMMILLTMVSARPERMQV